MHEDRAVLCDDDLALAEPASIASAGRDGLDILDEAERMSAVPLFFGIGRESAALHHARVIAVRLPAAISGSRVRERGVRRW